MAKSTIRHALASLTHKYQNKIREVGMLKKLINEGNASDHEVQRLLSRNESLEIELLGLQKKVQHLEFGAQYSEGAFKRLDEHAANVAAARLNAEESASNWKSMSGILLVVGIAVGSLSMLAYLTQTSGL